MFFLPQKQITFPFRALMAFVLSIALVSQGYPKFGFAKTNHEFMAGTEVGSTLHSEFRNFEEIREFIRRDPSFQKLPRWAQGPILRQTELDLAYWINLQSIGVLLETDIPPESEMLRKLWSRVRQLNDAILDREVREFALEIRAGNPQFDQERVREFQERYLQEEARLSKEELVRTRNEAREDYLRRSKNYRSWRQLQAISKDSSKSLGITASREAELRAFASSMGDLKDPNVRELLAREWIQKRPLSEVHVRSTLTSNQELFLEGLRLSVLDEVYREQSAKGRTFESPEEIKRTPEYEERLRKRFTEHYRSLRDYRAYQRSQGVVVAAGSKLPGSKAQPHPWDGIASSSLHFMMGYALSEMLWFFLTGDPLIWEQLKMGLGYESWVAITAFGLFAHSATQFMTSEIATPHAKIVEQRTRDTLQTIFPKSVRKFEKRLWKNLNSNQVSPRIRNAILQQFPHLHRPTIHGISRSLGNAIGSKILKKSWSNVAMITAMSLFAGSMGMQATTHLLNYGLFHKHMELIRYDARTLEAEGISDSQRDAILIENARKRAHIKEWFHEMFGQGYFWKESAVHFVGLLGAVTVVRSTIDPAMKQIYERQQARSAEKNLKILIADSQSERAYERYQGMRRIENPSRIRFPMPTFSGRWSLPLRNPAVFLEYPAVKGTVHVALFLMVAKAFQSIVVPAFHRMEADIRIVEAQREMRLTSLAYDRQESSLWEIKKSLEKLHEAHLARRQVIANPMIQKVSQWHNLRSEKMAKFQIERTLLSWIAEGAYEEEYLGYQHQNHPHDVETALKNLGATTPHTQAELYQENFSRFVAITGWKRKEFSQIQAGTDISFHDPSGIHAERRRQAAMRSLFHELRYRKHQQILEHQALIGQYLEEKSARLQEELDNLQASANSSIADWSKPIFFGKTMDFTYYPISNPIDFGKDVAWEGLDSFLRIGRRFWHNVRVGTHLNLSQGFNVEREGGRAPVVSVHEAGLEELRHVYESFFHRLALGSSAGVTSEVYQGLHSALEQIEKAVLVLDFDRAKMTLDLLLLSVSDSKNMASDLFLDEDESLRDFGMDTSFLDELDQETRSLIRLYLSHIQTILLTPTLFSYLLWDEEEMDQMRMSLQDGLRIAPYSLQGKEVR